MADSPAIDVRQVSHSYGAREVLSDVSLQVMPREIVAIMGSSGGGKTTLLKCISGLVTPTRGEVLVEGVSMQKEPEQARSRLGMVFQSAALFDYMNVRDNLLFGVRRRKRLSASQQSELAERLLKMVSLEGAADLMPSELSGGMRKRVGLARALAAEPQVLLFDEPTSGLDPVTAYAIDELIVRTSQALGVTSVVVSHDVSSVFRVASRIAFLHEGRLRFVGTPEEFRSAKDDSISDLVEKASAEAFFSKSG